MTKGEKMAGSNDPVMGLVEGVEDIATAMITLRNRLIEADYSPQAADAAGLQYQSFLATVCIEQLKKEGA